MQIINAYLIASDIFLMSYYENQPGWSSFDASTGTAFVRQQTSLRLSGGSTNDHTGANSSSISWYVNLAPGTYAFTISGPTHSEASIYEMSLDGVVFGTQDFYSGSTVQNFVAEVTGISVVSESNYLLKVQANGKNASSSGYDVYVSWFTFTRTGV